MKDEEFEKITSISFPNTIADDNDRTHFTRECGCTFERVIENGEMANITWFAVFKDGKKIAQIKQSICDIYFN